MGTRFVLAPSPYVPLALLPPPAAQQQADGGASTPRGLAAPPLAALHFACCQHPVALATASASLLAFIQSPISVSILDGASATGGAAPKSTAATQHQQPQPQQARFPPWKLLGLTPSHGATNNHHTADQGKADDGGAVAVESDSGRRRRVYRPRGGLDPGKSPGGAAASWEGFEITEERRSHRDHLRAIVAAYLLPNGFPESVAPQYAPYMAWRGVQYFFGELTYAWGRRVGVGGVGEAYEPSESPGGECVCGGGAMPPPVRVGMGMGRQGRTPPSLPVCNPPPNAPPPSGPGIRLLGSTCTVRVCG